LGRTAKVSSSLPDELLKSVEQARSVSGEWRSDFFRHAAENLLCHEKEKEAEARYVQGYLDHPETKEEMALAKFSETMLAEVQR
jgi:metal-responsive CopG/Arc/MetJ family transcriptional regulator